MSSSRAFTLFELLVVIATIAIVAAVLFPVFSAAKAAAKTSSCLAHFRVVSSACAMYMGDYDGVFPPVNYQPGQTPNSRVDRTWVQMLLPYAPAFKVFECPADNSMRPGVDQTFDQDLVPGDLYSQYYTASLHTNMGYNFQYLAPIYQQGGTWECRPQSESDLPRPASTLLYLDSVWSVQNGTPVGGGNWLVSPPCRYEMVAGRQVDTFAEAIWGLGAKGASLQIGTQIYTIGGWEPQQDSENVYGGVWLWHQGRSNVCTVGGSARSMTIGEITSGCDMKPQWSGNILNRSIYEWSPE